MTCEFSCHVTCQDKHSRGHNQHALLLCHSIVCWGGLQAEQVLGGTRSTRADAEVLADQSVISHYQRLTGKSTASTSAAAAGSGGAASKQRPIEGECAICYDTLKVCSARSLCSTHSVDLQAKCRQRLSMSDDFS